MSEWNRRYPNTRQNLKTVSEEPPAGNQTRGDRPPWDPANGLRAGLLAGALVGAGLIALTGLTGLWIILATALIGGALGYWREKRKQPR